MKITSQSATRRSRAVVALCALTMLCQSCAQLSVTIHECTEQAKKTATMLGFMDEAPKPPRHVIVLADPTAIEDENIVIAQVVAAARALCNVPGSTIRLDSLGEGEAGVYRVYEVTVPEPAALGVAARAEESEAFVIKVEKGVKEAWAAACQENPTPNESLIPEGIASETVFGVQPNTELIVITDGKPYRARQAASRVQPAHGNRTTASALVLSDVAAEDAHKSVGIDGECSIPSPDVFIKYLDAHGVLKEGSLNNVVVKFADMRPRPVENHRCVATVNGIDKLQLMWRAGLDRATAADVSFYPGVAPVEL